MKPGMLMPTGQPPMQAGFLHWMQRPASRRARSSGNPRETSLKFFRRSCGGCSGIFIRFGSMSLMVLGLPGVGSDILGLDPFLPELAVLRGEDLLPLEPLHPLHELVPVHQVA